jgi:hypothetical protein
MKKIFVIVVLVILSITSFSNAMLSQTNVVQPRTSNSFREYEQYLEISEKFALIPGLEGILVPQGLAYIEEKDWFAISYYQKDNYSVLSFVDGTTGEMVKSLIVCNEDGMYYTGHAGGLAVSYSNLWISSGSYIRKIPLQQIYDTDDGEKIKIVNKFNTGTNASFATFNDGVLWVGEFFHDNNYLTDGDRYVRINIFEVNHSWVVGFKLDKESDTLVSADIIDEKTPVIPDYILSIPDIVQGIAFLGNDEVALSQSYGRANDSTIQVYGNILLNAEHRKTDVNGTAVPTWILNSKNVAYKLTTFPMSENIVPKDGLLYILYESAAKKYLPTTKYGTDYIWKTNLNLINH